MCVWPNRAHQSPGFPPQGTCRHMRRTDLDMVRNKNISHMPIQLLLSTLVNNVSLEHLHGNGRRPRIPIPRPAWSAGGPTAHGNWGGEKVFMHMSVVLIQERTEPHLNVTGHKCHKLH